MTNSIKLLYNIENIVKYLKGLIVMKIWSMNLQSAGVDSFNFCKKRSIIGIGWGLKEESTNDWNVYKKLAPYYYEASDNPNAKAFRMAINYMDEIETNDLV